MYEATTECMPGSPFQLVAEFHWGLVPNLLTLQLGLTAGLQLLQDVLLQKFGVLLGHLARQRQQLLQRCALARPRGTNEACRQMQSMCGGASPLWIHNLLQQGANVMAS